MEDISGLTGKVENEGLTSKGRLSAEEFNTLVSAVIESQEGLETLKSYFDPISESEYNNLGDNLEEGRPYFIYED